ncbi:substrate-binding domain-containing protein [Herbiconiux sp. L3-i23]|uniref:substrate-binding domain-containing protein n=1 Tax=Herbiconiux sp. L3-i23 TaxID=2905871 RepID=UPI00206DD4C9|nr:substrate-binding domain-containing protein [Herbiconiux sp. L3-i23]BDI23622.1 ABC transporter substrate-binding protein [Herbiconiux sp. L3-i23]
MSTPLGRTALVLVLALLATLTGCAPADTRTTIALLLPESKTTRYEAVDRPVFESRLQELGDYKVLYSNADQDAAKQQSQAEAALASGAAVLVLDPVDAEAARSIVAAANAQDVPVIAYDRLPSGGGLAYYVSFDNERIGELQGSAFADVVGSTPGDSGILMVNGSPTDPNAREFETGALREIEEAGLTVLASFDTPDWSPDQAQNWTAGQITRFGSRIVGVYAANDGTAGGAIAALRAANVSPMPVVSGQDAELAGLQRIVTGDQYLTIYKAMRTQARLAAEAAVALANGEEVDAETTVDGTPATILPASVVTVDTIMSTVVEDGVYTIDQICTSDYAAACAAAGLQ